jgi:DNA-binding beta-propeller fold protein YncE
MQQEQRRGRRQANGRAWAVVLVLGLLAGVAGCSGNKTVVTVQVSPQAAVVVLGGSQQFSATVQGTSNTNVNWSVSGSGCSGNGCGTISSSGLYTAPTTLPNPNTVTITATSQADPNAKATAQVTLDSGIRVTMTPTSATVGTGERITLTATITGTTNTTVNWAVNGVANGNDTNGHICIVGSNPCQAPSSPVNMVDYVAPATAPTAPVQVTATAAADSTKVGTAQITVLAAVDPVLASITPTVVAQGSLAQDIYLTPLAPSSFFSTSTVLVNGTPVPTVFIRTQLLRARIPQGLLQTAGAVSVAVQAQNGHVSNQLTLQVQPVRPAIVSFSPVSLSQCAGGGCGPATITLHGGYFSPFTQVAFNGQPVGATLNSANELLVAVPGSALTQAGLYELTLANPGATQPVAGVNVAVEPDPTANPPAVLATLPVGTNPTAVAVNPVTGVAVVVNTGANSVTLVDVKSCSGGSCPMTTVPVGNTPTGVAIDPLRNLALVVNQGDKTLSLVDLSGAQPTQTVALPSGLVPVSVGENPETGHALVANQSTNQATFVDLSTNPPTVQTIDLTQNQTRPGGTGGQPRVVVVPRLDWAVVTPGGAGAISAVDMSHTTFIPGTGQQTLNIVFSFTLSATAQGIALQPFTDRLLITDPNGANAAIFNLLNQSVSSVLSVGTAVVAAAVNPLTNVGLVVNRQSSTLTLVDLGTAQILGSSIPVGSFPNDVAVDAATNRAVVVNQGDGTVSVVALGAVRPLALLAAVPSRLMTSSTPVTLTLFGSGFQTGAVVRVDGVALPAGSVQANGPRQLTVQLPASLVSAARLLNLDVQNPDGTLSNLVQVPVIQPVTVGNGPVAVALDPTRRLAVVTNATDRTVSLVNIDTGSVQATVPVGTNPQAVGVLWRLGKAVVANQGDNNVSIVDLDTASATVGQLGQTTGLAQGPIAVAIDSDQGNALVANQNSNNVSVITADKGIFDTTIAVDQGPLGVAVDPDLRVAAVVAATQSPPQIDLINLAQTPPFLTAHLPGANLPIGVDVDVLDHLFLVADSGGNRVLVVDPQVGKFVQNISVGINPTAIAFNLQTRMAVTINKASHTASVIEMTPAGSQVRQLLAAEGSSQQSVAIDPLTNLAVVVDQANNRVLLVPIGH